MKQGDGQHMASQTGFCNCFTILYLPACPMSTCPVWKKAAMEKQP